MSCYHPLIGIYRGEKTEKGANYYHIRPCPSDPLDILETFPGSVIIPCGKCIGCKINYSRQWADRMMLELAACNKGIFVTLTYANSDPNVPIVTNDDGDVIGLTLRKKDVSDFLKRLRSRQRFEDKTIRFFAAGEYGPKTLRPHYHAIIFGLSLDDFPDRDVLGVNELNQKYYVSSEFTEIWSHGYTMMSDVSWNTCAYVARYVVKKMGSDLQEFDPNFQKEFTLMSRRPGIGKPYIDLFPDKLFNEHIYLGTDEDSLEIPMPRYFRALQQLTDPERFAIMIEQRKKSASSDMILKLANTSLSYLDKLEQDENLFLNKIKPLKRNTF